MAVFVVYRIRTLLLALQVAQPKIACQIFSEDRPSLGWLDRACPKGGKLKPEEATSTPCACPSSRNPPAFAFSDTACELRLVQFIHCKLGQNCICRRAR